MFFYKNKLLPLIQSTFVMTVVFESKFVLVVHCKWLSQASFNPAKKLIFGELITLMEVDVLKKIYTL